MSNINYVELNGEKVSMKEYCRRLNYNYKAINLMMHRHNLSFEDAIARQKIIREGKFIRQATIGSEAEYCRKYNYNYKTVLAYKYNYKVTFEKAVEMYLYNKNKRKTKDQRLRRIWLGMNNRCYNSHNIKFNSYGGRGIKVCDAWHDYFNFEDDMYESYQAHVEEYGEKDTTLDRIDVNGDYCIENCRWSTYKEQANNTRNNLILIDNLTMSEASKKYNIPYGALQRRLYKGWTIEKALNTPKRIAKYQLPCNKSLYQHCKDNNYTYSSVFYHIKNNNLSVDEALARYLSE